MKIVNFILGIILLMIVFSFIKNNITPKGLGVKDGKLSKLPSTPNCVSTETLVEEKKVMPFSYKGSYEDSKEKIIQIIINYPGAKIVKNQDKYIYAVFTTKVMKYKDDVEFYFDDELKEVKYRSASRKGYSDMGLNKERYEKIKLIYNK